MLLLVDDDPAVAAALSDAGHFVNVAAGALALAAARRLSPRLIVLAHLGEIEPMRLACARARVLYLTDTATLAERIAVFACGACAYIVRSEIGVLVAAAEALSVPPAASVPRVVAARSRLH